MEDNLKHEIQSRWREIFSSLQRGNDVSPSKRLRTEGLMEAANLIGCWREEEQYRKMQAIYRELSGEDLNHLLGFEWRSLHIFPEIPAYTKRAPVFPSTTD